MQIKVICECKQKFAFEVEPKNGRMPFKVNCPVCGRDGTSAANALIAANFAAANKKTILVRPDPIVELPVNAPPPIFVSPVGEPAPPPSPPQKLNLRLGITGAIILIGLHRWFGLPFPLLGVGGILTFLISAGVAYKLAASPPKKGLEAYRKPEGGLKR